MNEKQFNEIHKKLAGPTAAPGVAFTVRQRLARSVLGRQGGGETAGRGQWRVGEGAGGLGQ